jgi:Na+/proline symporter/signal transduction histidine kinase
MTFNIDSAIFIGFLVVNLVFGLLYSLGIKSSKEYAVGDRNFSTSTIVATIVATWASGSFFFNVLSETYSNGLFYIWSCAGLVLSFCTVGFIYAPRMGEFLGKLSIAEAMGGLYGDKVRVATAVAGFIGTAGYIAVQLKVIGSLFDYCFNINGNYGVIIGAFIVILYSSLGGIKSVTFTDIIQLLTFGTIVPIIAFFILKKLDNLDTVFFTLTHNPLFNYEVVFDFTQPKSFYYLFFFFYAMIPSLSPPVFQRITMAKNTEQVQRSFLISAAVCFFLMLIVMWIGVLTIATTPNLNPKDVTKHILFNYSYVGLKGLTLAGIMAMAMSTIDSFINSSAVLLSNDFFKPLKIRLIKNDLLASRVSAVLIGSFALMLALREQKLLSIVLTAYSFYMPVVTVPFSLAILGFRSSSKSVLIGMSAGIITVLIWKITNITFVDAIVPGMIANSLGLFGSHYLLNQPGGWRKIKREHELVIAQQEKAKKTTIFTHIKNFKFIDFVKKNTPSDTNTYIAVGFFCMIMIYSTMHTIPKEATFKYPKLMEFLTFSNLCAATMLLSYPLWLESWRNRNLIAALVWNIVVFSVLCSSLVFVIISNFASMQVLIFMINVIIIAGLLRWQWALFLISFGIFLTLLLFKNYIDSNVLAALDVIVQFKIIYLLLLTSGVVVTIFRPKQNLYEFTERKAEALEGEKTILDHKVANLDTQVKTLEVQKVRLTGDVTALNLQVRATKDEKAKLIYEISNLGTHVTGLEDEKARLTNRVKGLSTEVASLESQVGDLNERVTHYTEQIADKDKEIDRLGQTSQRILNNVSHELRLPIGNVVNFAEMLQGTLAKSENNKLLKELAKEVYDNSNRVSSMILNMLDLATLAVKKVDLEKTMVNFSELVFERVKRCQKIYQNGKNIEFKLDIEPGILISVDPNYMRQTVDNLVINSINFSKEGLINISVVKKDGAVIFTITDQGVGIPKEELHDIFTPFSMGSNTESKACGRGVGLSLCKSAVEAHGGSITADSNGECGAKLQFTLPFGNNQ